MKKQLYILEYNQQQGGFHIQRGNVQQNTFGWETVFENISDSEANEFCETMAIKYPSTDCLNTERDKMEFPSLKTIKKEFTMWMIVKMNNDVKFAYTRIEYDETKGRFHLKAINTNEYKEPVVSKNKLIISKISFAQCLEFIHYFMKKGSLKINNKSPRRIPSANEVKITLGEFLLSNPNK